MHMATQSSTPTSQNEAGELARAVAVVFKTFARAFATKWEKTLNDPRAPVVWERTMAMARLTVPQIRGGLAKAVLLAWPPSAGEFVELCRDPVPLEHAALEEAIAWAKAPASDEPFEWTHPAIRAAARAIGAWDIRAMSSRDLRRTWSDVWRKVLERYQRGEPLEVAQRKALSHGLDRSARQREVTTAGQAAIAAMARSFGRSS